MSFWLQAIKVLTALSLLMPLVLAPSQFIYPFIVPKILYFRCLVELMVAGYVILWMGRKDRYRPRWTPITIGLALWCASFTLSTIFGVDPYRSMWDTHERMLGCFTILHYAAYAFVCAQVLRGWATWRWLLRLLLLGTIVVVGIALYQRFGDPQYLYNKGQKRVSSTLGHPSYLSGLGAFTALTGLLIFMRDWVARAKSRLDPDLPDEVVLHDPVARVARFLWHHGIEVFAMVGGLIAVVLSETRGTVVGLAVGVFVLALGYGWTLRKQTDRSSRLGLRLAVLAIMAMVALGGFLVVARQNETIRAWIVQHKVPGLRRFVTLTTTHGTLHTRLMTWGMGIDAALERPVLGWGPNNFYYAFNQNYRPEFLSYNHQETWFDNAHNVVVNTAAVQGILGLLIYLFLCGAPVVLLVRAYRAGRIDKHLAVIGTAMLTTHFVHNVAVFENPTSYLYFMLMLAFFDSELRAEKEVVTGAFDAGPLTPTLAIGVAVVAIWAGNWEPARANMAGLDAIRLINSGDAKGALAALDRSENTLSPHRDGARNMFAEASLKAVAPYTKSKNPQVREALLPKLKRLLERSFSELGENKALHPLDVRVVIGRAKVAEQLWAQFPSTKQQITVQEIEAEVREAIELSPRRQELGYLLADMLLAQGKLGESIELLARIRDDEPSVGESWMRLANAYLRVPGLQGTAKAIALLTEAKAAHARVNAKFVEEVKALHAAQIKAQAQRRKPAPSRRTTPKTIAPKTP